jgi:hypothetical protein
VDAEKHTEIMKIREIVYTKDPKIIHPDINKILNKYQKRAKGKRRMGYHSMMAYPFRVR